MIFVTTGTQLPFPRLIAEIDRLAADLDEEIVAQVGPDPAVRANVACHRTLDPARFEALFRGARVVVAHAGIGSILSAKKYRRPLILVPRRHALGEHRNDHQMATAREMAARPGFHVAWETADLEALLARPDLEPPDERISPSAEGLIARIRNFIDQ